jgi:hypothetical protein
MARPDRLARLANVVGALMLSIVADLYLLFDKLAAVSLYPVAVVSFAALGVIACLPLLAGRSRAVQLALPLLVVLLVLMVQLINWDSRKPFLRALDRIEPGLTVEQVDTLMSGYLRSPARPGTSGDSSVIAYRHTDEGWGNSDIALITIINGHVTSREFLPD